MTELITILLVTLSQLVNQGVPDDALAKGIEQAIMADPPVAIEEFAVEVKRTKSGDFDLNFDIEDIYIDPMIVQDLELSIGAAEVLPNGNVAFSALEFRAELADNALTQTLAPQAGKIKGLNIHSTKAGIVLTGSYPALVTKIPFEVAGGLSVEDETQLIFSIDGSKLIGVSLPKKINQLIEDEVNPVFDLLDFAKRSAKDIEKLKDRIVYDFEFAVTKLEAADGHIVIVGSA